MTIEKTFQVILLGIVFDPKTKKILIGRKENDYQLKNLSWSFPGGRASQNNEDLDETLKNKIKLKTGFEVANLGSIFSKTYPEKRNLLAVYYLCEIIGGKEKAGDDLKELKWVNPEEIEKHFEISFHPNLKEYIINLK